MKKRILVIDDEQGFTRLLKEELERTNAYEVKVANNGTEGLAAFRSFRPDLVLLDIVIPDMTGADIAIQIKEVEAFKNVPIIFVTATALKEETQKFGGTIGGQCFLAKPVTIEEVTASIEQHLGK